MENTKINRILAANSKELAYPRVASENTDSCDGKEDPGGFRPWRRPRAGSVRSDLSTRKRFIYAVLPIASGNRDPAVFTWMRRAGA
jgi:hypothetical protein